MQCTESINDVFDPAEDRSMPLLPQARLIASCKQALKGVSLSGKNCVVVGATQGIGKAVALNLASLGANVTGLGRSVDDGALLLESMRNATDDIRATHFFNRIDLVKQAETTKALEALKNDLQSQGGLDYLFVTAGKTPNGKLHITDEGLDAHFALQCLGRFRCAFELAPLMNDGGGVTIVCAPSQGGSALPTDDIEYLQPENRRKYWLLSAAQRDSLFLDSVLYELGERFDKFAIHHLFPGIVNTNLAANAGFPFPIPQLAGLVLPYIATSAEDYASFVVWNGLCSPEAVKGQGYYAKNERGALLDLRPWSKEFSNRQACIDYAQERIAQAQETRV